jgi:hypothetical protein
MEANILVFISSVFFDFFFGSIGTPPIGLFIFPARHACLIATQGSILRVITDRGLQGLRNDSLGGAIFLV